MPLIGNKYFEFYKNFLKDKIDKSNINEILIFKHENIPEEVFTNYINKECFETYEDEIFYIYKLICLK